MELIGGLHDLVGGLAGVDPDAVSDAELHALVVGLQRERDRLAVVAARLLAAWDARRVWAGDGSKSAAHRLARETSCSVGSARRELRRASHARAMPVTVAAVLDGRLSVDHVDLLGSARGAGRQGVFADHEAGLVDLCAGLRFAPAQRAVRYWCQRADALTGAAEPTRATGNAALRCSTTFEGVVVVDGTLDAVGGALVAAELRRLAAGLRAEGRAIGVERPVAAWRAEALVEMARRSATAPAGGKAPHVVLQVLVGEGRFREVCELVSGTVVAPGHLAGWLDDAVIQSVLFDGPTTVVGVSAQRSFTGALRTAIEVRDRHCQHPSGCDTPAPDCDVDHIVPWAEGGPTSQFNGRLLCATHNRHPDRRDRPSPHPARSVTRLDVLRCRLRWAYRHSPDDPP